MIENKSSAMMSASMNSTTFVTLSNGVQIPTMGFGIWPSSDPRPLLRPALRVALDVGYRHIDTATAYGNEHIVGDVLQEYYRSGMLTRSDIFLTTKLPCYGHNDVEKFVAESLKQLCTDYIDLYLIHLPTPIKKPVEDDDKCQPLDIPIIDTWRELEAHYKKGTFRAIGVANFNEKQLRELYDKADIKPHNIQIELHIFLPQNSLVSFSKSLSISVTSYGTFGGKGDEFMFGSSSRRHKLFNQSKMAVAHPLVVELSRKYYKTRGQILLRHMLQRGIIIVPKSLDPQRIRHNFDVFDFDIDSEDMQRFDIEIHRRQRLFRLDFFLNHPHYPFREENDIDDHMELEF